MGNISSIKKYVLTLGLGSAILLSGCGTDGEIGGSEKGEEVEDKSVSEQVEDVEEVGKGDESVEDAGLSTTEKVEEGKEENQVEVRDNKEDISEKVDNTTSVKEVELEEIVKLANLTLEKSQAKYGTDLVEFQLDKDDGKYKVEIDLQNNKVNTEAKYNAQGKLVESESDDLEDIDEVFKYNDLITVEDALAIAYQEIGESEFESIELDKDDIVKYDIELSKGDIELNAKTGEIIDRDNDKDEDD